ncbi:hypothetical protein F442_17001 [Phytophthora nicotianae P10297]|uniref:Uncharacterized protein n=2 Tax=Phytophthora nicotianae TaxID=4792 RepID=W2YIW2_PHYNI|nr:hypothetical protein F442_17001 [Phytophthora nicotianae P10297]
MQAHIARIKFLSMCIKTWGYFGFLSQFEACTSNRRLMWMGGQPGRNTGDAKSYYGPVIENLRELLRRYPDAYMGKMRSALQPFRLDEGGFTNLTSLLVNLGALDPNNPKKEHRLSDRALARVLHDIISRRKRQSWWFGVGWPWDSLRNCARIVQREAKEAKALREGTYQEPTAPAYDERELQGTGLTHFVFSDATFAARGPGEVRTPDLDDDGTEQKPPATATSTSEAVSVPAADERSTSSTTKGERSSQSTKQSMILPKHSSVPRRATRSLSPIPRTVPVTASTSSSIARARRSASVAQRSEARRSSLVGQKRSRSPTPELSPPAKRTRSKGRTAGDGEVPKSKK